MKEEAVMEKYSLLPLLAATNLYSFTFATRAHAQSSSEAPETVWVGSSDSDGSGCPAGTTKTHISADKKTLSIVFANFGAQAGPGIMPEETRKSCQTMILLDFHGGWTYSLSNATFHSREELDEGVEGRLRASYWFPGAPPSSIATTIGGFLDGPPTHDWSKDFEVLNWAPCSSPKRPLYVKVDASISNAKNPLGEGSIELEQVLFGIRWQKCSRRPSGG